VLKKIFSRPRAHPLRSTQPAPRYPVPLARSDRPPCHAGHRPSVLFIFRGAKGRGLRGLNILNMGLYRLFMAWCAPWGDLGVAPGALNAANHLSSKGPVCCSCWLRQIHSRGLTGCGRQRPFALCINQGVSCDAADPGPSIAPYRHLNPGEWLLGSGTRGLMISSVYPVVIEMSPCPEASQRPLG
jgi:hypothetical protein